MCLLEQWPGVAVEVAGNVPSNLPPLCEATVGLWEECRPKLHVAALALCPADVGACWTWIWQLGKQGRGQGGRLLLVSYIYVDLSRRNLLLLVELASGSGSGLYHLPGRLAGAPARVACSSASFLQATFHG